MGQLSLMDAKKESCFMRSILFMVFVLICSGCGEGQSANRGYVISKSPIEAQTEENLPAEEDPGLSLNGD